MKYLVIRITDNMEVMFACQRYHYLDHATATAFSDSVVDDSLLDEERK